MGNLSTVAPVLSTPETHIFEAPVPIVIPTSSPRSSDADLIDQYEIPRTIREIKRNRWTRIALQFPDNLLSNAPRVYHLLQNGLKSFTPPDPTSASPPIASLAQDTGALDIAPSPSTVAPEEHLYILGDTSYGACCVDEVAADHVSAEVVVHYGRACLSPTARLPVIHVFTISPLALEPVVVAFKATYPAPSAKVVLMADVTYASYLHPLAVALCAEGYTNLFTTEILHDPASLLPNRTIPPDAENDPGALTSWALFHISDPPKALLLTLSSRVSSIHIYPTNTTSSIGPTTSPLPLLASTTLLLRRRYALVTQLSRSPIIGILINTLSVRSYLTALSRIQSLIAAAGKKSYVFVMGKLNAAKIANFAEVGGWVVVGCWESSLVESEEFEKPVVAPFELEVALMGDERRVWGGEWRGDFTTGVEDGKGDQEGQGGEDGKKVVADEGVVEDSGEGNAQNGSDLDSEEESEPPEFDLRTGRYISHSRPMRSAASKPTKAPDASSLGGANASKAEHALVKHAKGDMARIGGEISPGAEYLREKKTWRGLGSDFEIAYEEDGEEKVTKVQEGRSGIARGYADEGSGGGG